jgi:hypothetical protein
MEPFSSSPDPTVGPGGYPQFSDGDVLIISGTGRSWKLHSSALRNASKKFRAMFDEHEPRRITKKVKDDGKTIKWKLEMVPWDDKEDDTRFRSFRIIVSHLFLQRITSPTHIF